MAISVDTTRPNLSQPRPAWHCVLVHAGKLNAKTAEDLVKSAKEKKTSFIKSVMAGGTVTLGRPGPHPVRRLGRCR